MDNKLPYNPTVFTYKQEGYEKWLRDFAIVTNSEVINNTVTLSPDSGEGIARSFYLEEGFTALVNNYCLYEDYVFSRQPTEGFGVLIYMYHFHTEDPIEFISNNVIKDVGGFNNYTLRITNVQTSHQLKLTANTCIRGISLFLEKSWIEKNTTLYVSDVFNYLKEVNNFEQFVNVKQKKLMGEVVDLPLDHPYTNTFIKSRIYRIFDKVLENFLQRDISESPEKIGEDDFEMLQKIEMILTESFEEAFPGIEKLSRISLMSESKLKKLFKQAFGMGLYEYFQKNRMHFAREQILSGKYSISEVGIKLGYQNLSNFSTAFRKEFDCLPSQLVIP